MYPKPGAHSASVLPVQPSFTALELYLWSMRPYCSLLLAQSAGRCPSLGNIQGLGGWGSEKPGRVEYVPAHSSRGGLDYLLKVHANQVIPWFYDSWAILHLSEKIWCWLIPVIGKDLPQKHLSLWNAHRRSLLTGCSLHNRDHWVNGWNWFQRIQTHINLKKYHKMFFWAINLLQELKASKVSSPTHHTCRFPHQDCMVQTLLGSKAFPL